MRLLSFTPAYIKLLIGLFVIVIIAVVAVIIFYNSKPNCSNCNVILVSLDTLSALHLPCYGYERDTAPNLCAFASRNLLFKNSYSQSPTTLNSHFSIFTSLYPQTHKMTRISGPPLEEKYLTLTQVLRNNGYDTVYNGTLTDLHLPLNKGLERGFNIIRGNSNTKSWEGSYKLLEDNSKKGKKTFLFLHTYEVHSPYLTGHKAKHLYTDQKEYSQIPLTVDEYLKNTPEYINFAVDYIQSLAKDNRINPLYYKPYIDKDLVIAAEIKKEKNYNEKLKIYDRLSTPFKDASRALWFGKIINIHDATQVEYIKALYDERITEIDKKLEKLIKLVESPKYSKNTILIITADHGEEFMEHNYIYHSENLYKTSTLVPLIMHIPGIQPKKIKELVQGIDIYPTILSLLGLKPKSLIEGIDLTGIIRGDRNAATNKYLLSEYNGQLGIQILNWRFYYDFIKKQLIGLYNLDSDPKERKNVALENKEKVKEFLDLMGKLNISFN